MTPEEKREELIKFVFWIASYPCKNPECKSCMAIWIITRKLGFPYKRGIMDTYEQFEAWEKSK